LAPIVLQTLAEAFVPFEWSPDVQVLINRTTRAWVVGLINNNGVVVGYSYIPSGYYEHAIIYTTSGG
jgi:hypothetical protein